MRINRLFKCGIVAATVASAGNGAEAQEQVERQLDQLLHTSIGGYGVVRYQRDHMSGDATATLERFVLFAGHRFTKSLSLVSEVEFEDAKVTGGEPGGEVAVEQAYVKYEWSPRDYLVAGLFIPRIGILNEHHLPTEYNGNERPIVETLILPATWRELGVGVFGGLGGLPVEYSAAIVTGLNASGFNAVNGIREGRIEGFSPSANSLAFTGSLRWSIHPFILQASGYYGGTLSVPGAVRDSLRLPEGAFAAPLLVGEFDIRFSSGPWEAKALACATNLNDASQLSGAFAHSIARRSFGVFGEAGYDFGPLLGFDSARRCVLFVRYERLNLNDLMPPGEARDPASQQRHVITGLTFSPDPGVVVKGDLRFSDFAHTGSSTTLVNLGVGFSF